MEIYACYNKNEEVRKKSSSGGIFSLLAEEILNNQGVIFAVCYDENYETVHRKITSLHMLNSSLGAKYLQSRLGKTFAEVKKCLLEKRRVLFVGTPCQCAGLNAFLGKEFENLWLVDLVCHGVPSRVAWRKYLRELGCTQIKSINMRDKTTGWSEWNYNWKIKYKDGKETIIPQCEVPFMKGFVKDFYLRPSCYECCFKSLDRDVDITLGDYWGVWKSQPDMDDNKGTSVVMIHTDKGGKLFEQIKNRARISKANIETVVKYNPSILENASKTEKRREFFEKLKTDGMFKDIVSDLEKTDRRNAVFYKIRNICKRLRIS